MWLILWKGVGATNQIITFSLKRLRLVDTLVFPPWPHLILVRLWPFSGHVLWVLVDPSMNFWFAPSCGPTSRYEPTRSRMLRGKKRGGVASAGSIWRKRSVSHQHPPTFFVTVKPLENLYCNTGLGCGVYAGIEMHIVCRCLLVPVNVFFFMDHEASWTPYRWNSVWNSN